MMKSSSVQPESPPDLRGECALVTGSSSGIGLAVAEVLLRAGARVVINGRNPAKVAAAQQRLQTLGDVLGVPADVGDRVQVQKMFGRIREKFGPVGILVNNAGVARFDSFLETDEASLEEQLRTNLKGAFFCTQEALPDMFAARRGHIVMINSVAARTTFANCAAYAASKAGLLAMTDVLREEVRSRGIYVTTVLAGATDTPLWLQIGGNFDRSRMMPPGAVADAVLAALRNPGMVEEIQIRPAGGDL